MADAADAEPKRPREVEQEQEEEEDPRKFKGRRVSGRVWKDTINEPVRAMRKNKPLHSSWSVKQEQRAEMSRLREMDRARKQQYQDDLQAKREAREERQKRRKINERKAEITQKLNPKKLKQKLKTMNKKQLRAIRKEGVAPLLKEA